MDSWQYVCCKHCGTSRLVSLFCLLKTLFLSLVLFFLFCLFERSFNSLNLNWLLALLELCAIRLNQRTERRVYVAVFGLALCLFVVVVVFGVLRAWFLSFRASDVAPALQQAAGLGYAISSMVLNGVILLALLVLVGFSFAGWFLVRKKGGASPEQLRALLKMVISAALLVIAQAFKFALFVMQQQMALKVEQLKFFEILSEAQLAFRGCSRVDLCSRMVWRLFGSMLSGRSADNGAPLFGTTVCVCVLVSSVHFDFTSRCRWWLRP